MSVMICGQCDRQVDTDFNVEGIWTESDGYICESCTESNDLMEDNPGPEASPGAAMMKDFNAMLMGDKT